MHCTTPIPIAGTQRLVPWDLARGQTGREGSGWGTAGQVAAPPVREEAAESLAYSNYKQAIPPLISVLAESDVRIRFWAVFALGSIGRWRERSAADSRVIEALERMLPDQEVPPGNWWSVGREALAMLGLMEPQYQARLDSETQRVMSDAHSSPEDLRWADGYSLQPKSGT